MTPIKANVTLGISIVAVATQSISRINVILPCWLVKVRTPLCGSHRIRRMG